MLTRVNAHSNAELLSFDKSNVVSGRGSRMSMTVDTSSFSSLLYDLHKKSYMTGSSPMFSIARHEI